MNTTSCAPDAFGPTLPDHHAHLLAQHLHQCRDARGPWFTTLSLAERVNDALGSRFVTTVSVAGLVLFVVTVWA